MSFTLPFPETFIQWTWFLIGLFFARGFGKQVDQDIQSSDWFKSLDPIWQWLLKRFLDFLHHFWIGALIMIYGPIHLPSQGLELYWFGYGIFVDDLPDIPARFRIYFQYIIEQWKEK